MFPAFRKELDGGQMERDVGLFIGIKYDDVITIIGAGKKPSSVGNVYVEIPPIKSEVSVCRLDYLGINLDPVDVQSTSASSKTTG